MAWHRPACYACEQRGNRRLPIAAESAIATAQTIGELIEGQRQLSARMDRLEVRMDRLENKVDKLLWLGFGLLGTTVLVTAVAALFAVLRTVG